MHAHKQHNSILQTCDIEVRIAILTIENLNSRQSLLPERVTVDSSRNSCLCCRFSLSLLLAWPWEGWWKFRLVLEKKAFGSRLKSLVIDISSLFMYCGLVNYSAFCLSHFLLSAMLQGNVATLWAHVIWRSGTTVPNSQSLPIPWSTQFHCKGINSVQYSNRQLFSEYQKGQHLASSARGKF